MKRLAELFNVLRMQRGEETYRAARYSMSTDAQAFLYWAEGGSPVDEDLMRLLEMRSPYYGVPGNTAARLDAEIRWMNALAEAAATLRAYNIQGSPRLTSPSQTPRSLCPSSPHSTTP